MLHLGINSNSEPYEIIMHGHQTGLCGAMQPVQVAHQRVWQVCQLELCTRHHQSPLQHHKLICELAAFVLALQSHAGNEQPIWEPAHPGRAASACVPTCQPPAGQLSCLQ